MDNLKQLIQAAHPDWCDDGDDCEIAPEIARYCNKQFGNVFVTTDTLDPAAPFEVAIGGDWQGHNYRPASALTGLLNDIGEVLAFIDEQKNLAPVKVVM